MPLLLLIRHALTDATGRSLTGWTPGVHLSEHGRGQARALAERLTPVPVAAIYSSPLERCLETAEPVAAQKRLSVTAADALGDGVPRILRVNDTGAVADLIPAKPRRRKMGT